MRAFLAVLVGIIGWIVSLFVINLISDNGTPVEHGSLLAVIIGIFVGIGWYFYGRYPNNRGV